MARRATPHCVGSWLAHLFCYRRRARSKAGELLDIPLDRETVSLVSSFSDL